MRALLGKGRENGKVVGHVVSYTSPQRERVSSYQQEIKWSLFPFCNLPADG
jgi:hypothetical protein